MALLQNEANVPGLQSSWTQGGPKTSADVQHDWSEHALKKLIPGVSLSETCHW